jgi:hypothetical protein
MQWVPCRGDVANGPPVLARFLLDRELVCTAIDRIVCNAHSCAAFSCICMSGSLHVHVQKYHGNTKPLAAAGCCGYCCMSCCCGAAVFMCMAACSLRERNTSTAVWGLASLQIQCSRAASPRETRPRKLNVGLETALTQLPCYGHS